jgi:RNA polymerase sigma factor (sigma-70 family)
LLDNFYFYFCSILLEIRPNHMAHPFSTYSDREIYNGLLHDSDWAYKALMEEHTSKLKDYVLNNGGDLQDSLDIEQRVLIILYENIRSGKYIFREDVKISTYLFSIAQHQWIGELKSRKKYKTKGNEYYVEFSDDLSDNLYLDELVEELLKLLNALDPDCYKLIKFKYYDHLNDEEISNLLKSISVENVRKRRYKCLQKVKRGFINKYPLA